MEINPIRNDQDHAAALKEVEALFDAEEGTARAERLDVLATLIAHYEEKRWPIETPDPVAMLEFVMEQRGKSEADLAELLQDEIAAREVLQRKRYLTLPQMWRLEQVWSLPATSLVRQYNLVKD